MSSIDQPEVTVWIPSFNHAPFLPQAIESVLGQTFQDFELIIAEDGSSDNSLEIARGYERRHAGKMRVLTHPGHENRGIAATIKLATDSARGLFFCGLPSDDALPRDSIEVRVETLRPVATHSFVYGQARLFDREHPENGSTWSDDISGEREPVAALFLRNPIPGMTAMASRKAWLGTGDHDASLRFSDWDFWMRMITCWKPVFIPRVLALHRMTGRNATWADGVSGYTRNNLAVLKAARAKLAEVSNVLKSDANRGLLLRETALLHARLGERNQARQCVAEALTADPTLTCEMSFLSRWLEAGSGGEAHRREELIVELSEIFIPVLAGFGRKSRRNDLENLLVAFQVNALCELGSDRSGRIARRIAQQYAFGRPWRLFNSRLGRPIWRAFLGPRLYGFGRNIFAVANRIALRRHRGRHS